MADKADAYRAGTLLGTLAELADGDAASDPVYLEPAEIGSLAALRHVLGVGARTSRSRSDCLT
jgi:hypothetical protein